MNEENDQFEQRLKRQPLCQVPAGWRNEIISAANEARSVDPLPSVTGGSFLSVLNQRLSSLLWPHPVAWAGLAAIWVFICAVNFSMHDRTPVMAKKVSPPSPAVIAELRQQQRLYVELMGTADLGDADRPKVFVPRPRSERLEVLAA
jgi:hypothetical protein